MPSAQTIIGILEKTGHLRNPFGVPQSVPPVLAPNYPASLNDPLVMKGVASYQSMYAPELSPLIAKHHPERTSAMVRVDGVVGPATQELFDQPRCECPDYTADTFTAKALGSGGWKGCKRPNFHGCKIRETNAPPAHVAPIWAEVKRRATAALAKAGFEVEFITSGTGNVTLTWVDSSDGWIGLATVGNRAETCQTPESNRWMRLLKGYTQTWTDIERRIRALVLLLLHEFGHVQSLPHSPGSIMNSYIDESRKGEWIGVGDAYESTFRAMYGSEAIPGEPIPPGPNPPPTGSGYWPGLLVIDEKTGKKGRIFDQAGV